MPRRSRPERLIQEIQDWRDDELADLVAMVTGLLWRPLMSGGRTALPWDGMVVEVTSS